LPGPHERTSSVGPSILATRPRSLRRSFVFLRTFTPSQHTQERGHSKTKTQEAKSISNGASANQHRWTVHTRVSAHFVRSREARDRVRLHEREQAVMQGLPRITERPTTRTLAHHTRGRGGAAAGPAGARAGGRPRTGALSGALPYSRAVTQAPSLRNATTPLSGLRAPRRGPRRPCLLPP